MPLRYGAAVPAITPDGVHVATYDLGGHGPPLLLAHATGFHGRVLGPLATELAGHFHCWAFDERGHGDTPARSDGDFDWRGFAADALAVVDTVGLQRPFAFGHSCGGAALLLAEQARPGTFAGLFLYEPVLFPPRPDGSATPGSGTPLAAGARRRRDVFPSHEDAFANYASKPPFSRLDPAALRAYVDHGFVRADDGVRLKCRPENEARTYEAAATHTAFDHLSEVSCPVTIACGEHADTFDEALIVQQAARLPHGRTMVLPGLSHFGPMENPGMVARAVADALAAG